MNNILFFGTYQHKIDSQGMVLIPSEWRKHIKENKIYYYGNKSFVCYTSIEAIKEKYPNNYQNFVLEMLPKIQQSNYDKKYRIHFKEKEKLVIFKGYGDYFTVEFQEL